ncbi:MAG TPA: hypothetical protein VLG71_01500 [Candidatus Limnocylindria bacterium]|nr:hypothetical protein [Candidatus Limnocylindria bacterium]
MLFRLLLVLGLATASGLVHGNDQTEKAKKQHKLGFSVGRAMRFSSFYCAVGVVAAIVKTGSLYGAFDRIKSLVEVYPLRVLGFITAAGVFTEYVDTLAARSCDDKEKEAE